MPRLSVLCVIPMVMVCAAIASAAPGTGVVRDRVPALTWQNAPNCGVASVINLCWLLGRELRADEMLRLYAQYPEDQLSMASLKQALQQAGVRVVGVKADLQELGGLGQPCIIHLRTPDHYVVLIDHQPPIARVLDRGAVHVRASDVLQRGMSGYALVLDADGQPATGARCRFRESDFDCGTITADAEPEHVFGFANTGSGALAVSVTGKSCSCAAVLQDPRPIPPGGQGGIKVSLPAGQRGTVLETIALSTNDPARPRILLTLRAFVPLALRANPERLHYVTEKGDVSSTLALQVTGSKDMRVTGVTVDVPFVTVSPETRTEEDTAEGRWRFLVRVEPSAPVGQWRAQIDMHTDSLAKPVLHVAVAGRTRGDIEVRPSAIMLSSIAVGAQVTTTVRVVSRSRTPFTITRCRCPDAFVKVPRQSGGPRPAWEIPITVRGDRLGARDATVVLNTDVDREGIVEVPVSAYVVPAKASGR